MERASELGKMGRAGRVRGGGSCSNTTKRSLRMATIAFGTGLLSIGLLSGVLTGCVAMDDRASVTPAPRCPMGHQDKRACMPDSGRGLCTKANRSDC